MGERVYSTKISILLPTTGKRIAGLNYQMAACMNQTYPGVRLLILADCEKYEYETIKFNAAKFNDSRITVYKVPDEFRGKWGHAPIRWAVEQLPLENWFLTTGDDDAMLPWAAEKLVEAIEQFPTSDIIIGKCLPVKRNADALRMMLGDEIRLGKITGSCCIYKTDSVKKIGYDDSEYIADWVLIEKMMEMNYTLINTVLFVMPQF